MGDEDRTAITVFLARPTPADSLALVALADDSLVILLNGKVLEDCRWRVEQAEMAVTVYRDVLARLKAVRAAGSP